MINFYRRIIFLQKEYIENRCYSHENGGRIEGGSRDDEGIIKRW